MATTTQNILSLADRGRSMTLAEFIQTSTPAGLQSELERGEIVMSEIPGIGHGRVVSRLKIRLGAHIERELGGQAVLMGGSDCRFDIEATQSSRHPDIAVYTTPSPNDDYPWAEWVPALAIEVTSPGQESRDLQLKAEEYLRFGIAEYWVVDPQQRTVVRHHRRGGMWATASFIAGQRVASTSLRGFEVGVDELFA